MAQGEAQFRIGVLASGGGSTAEAVKEAIDTGDLPDTEIAFIASNNSAANPEAGVWERAERLGIPIHHISNKTQPECTLPEHEGLVLPGTISYEASEKMLQMADEYGVHMLVALGFMKRVVGRVLEEVPIANTHPGPLGPDRITAGYHGTGVQERIMQLGLRYSGPTFHWMETEVDEDTGLPAYDAGKEIGHFPVKVTDQMQAQWDNSGDVTLLKNEVMRVEKLWVPSWIHKALRQTEANG